MQTEVKTTAREYLRVSKDTSGRERSLEEQHAENVDQAERHGWTLLEPYSDVGSASRFASRVRGDFATLTADLEADRFGADVLVLWESSRGSRRVGEWVTLLEQLEQHGVRIHVTTHSRTYDPANGRDRRSLLEDATDSEYESWKLSQRIKRSMAASAQAGRPHGRVKYGYVRRYDQHTKQLIAQEIDPETGPVVRRIFRDVVASVPISAIRAALNDEGIPSPTGKRWARDVVRRVAMAPAYIARRRHNGSADLLEGDWPPMVTEAEYWAAQRILTDPSRKTTRPGRAKYLLSYIARSQCGGFLSAAHGREFYACEIDSCVNIKLEWLDRYVEKILLGVLAKPAEYAALAQADDSAVIAARGEAEALRSRLDEFYDAAARGELTPAALARVEQRLLPQIDAAAKRAVEVATPPVLRTLTEPGADVVARWQAMPMAARREAVGLLADVVVRKAPRGKNTFDDVPGRVDVTPRATS